MATYHISTAGNDSNDGLSWGAAFRTFAQVLDSGSPLVGGDEVWIRPGVYREVNAMAHTALASEVRFRADTFGLLGSGTTGAVRLSAFTTDDSTAPSTSPVLTFNQRPFLTFEDIIFEGGNNATGAACWQMAATTGGHVHHVKAKRCLFLCPNMAGGVGSLRSVDVHFQFGVDGDVIFEDSWFDGNPGFNSAHIFAGLVNSASGSHYDCGLRINGCRSIGSLLRAGLDGGAATNKGGGIAIDDAYVLNGVGMVVGADVSTTVPCTIQNAKIMTGNGVALSANTSGQIVEDLNDIWASTPRTNVSAGASSTANSKSRLAAHAAFVSEYAAFMNQINGVSEEEAEPETVIVYRSSGFATDLASHL